MKLPSTGGCVCGEIRYECDSRPLTMLKCHCRDCQRVSGGHNYELWDIMDADLPKHREYPAQ
ncbi:MAG TPA: hypothetical protein VHG71_06825 [Verrucomicrobiae bacterium]|nr:hypothetical protein [Verrucomicrobiae bacterium]